MKLRWKKEPHETGLRAVGAAPRSSIYHDGKLTYAMVSPLGGGWRGPVRGWYWTAGWDTDIPRMNTAGEPCATEAEAKAKAAEYVKAHLAS